jgi:hypothetical protein
VLLFVLFHSLLSLVALYHLCVDLCRQDEVPIENLYAADLVPLPDVNLATKRTVVYTLLDFVLWPGLSVLTATLSLWYQTAIVDIDYPAATMIHSCLAICSRCPLFGGRGAFAAINYLDQSVQKKNGSLVYCDVIST